MIPSQDKQEISSSLPTWTPSGKRLWVYPHRLPGKHASSRKWVAIFLLIVFLVVPWLEWGGMPFLRFDIRHNSIFVFTQLFRLTDATYLLFLFLGIGFGLFFITAYRGRVFCGYICPQTVFLDWLIRPIEEWIEGPAAKRRLMNSKGLDVQQKFRRAIKHVIFFLIAVILSHNLIAFFIKPSELAEWMSGDPRNHFITFGFASFFALLLYFDFAYVREQFCSFLCPYARFQSILIDRHTPAVSYDLKRGEPRGKKSGGDCIDCKLCVRVCPAGIDIRNGTQLECIQCMRCVDACDSVMLNVGRKAGLIRMASFHDIFGGVKAKFKIRPLIYGSIVLISGFLALGRYSGRKNVTVYVTRQSGAVYAELPTGEIMNSFKFALSNTTKEAQDVSLKIIGNSEGKIICGVCNLPLKAYQALPAPVIITFPKSNLPDFVEVEMTSTSERWKLPFIGPK
jgi:cytochrome c oxidase accessory protein FixG